MDLRLAPRAALQRRAPLVVCLLAQDGKAVKVGARTLPAGALYRRAARLVGRRAFKADKREVLLLHADDAAGPRALLLVGLGPRAQLGLEDLRRAGALACQRASDLKVTRVLLATDAPLAAGQLQALAEGAALTAYRYPERPAKTPPVKELAIVVDAPDAASTEALARASALARAANLTRTLGDLPGNLCTPRHLADAARKVCASARLRCKVHGPAELQRLGMGGILGVNQGSAQPAFLVEMEYRPSRFAQTVCVVGKGLTFDSGGISIKPADKMEEMKYDMCGAAAVIGLMAALGELRPQGVRVVGIFGTTENMPGPNAYKPGDVVRTASGKTIEVINTDAEGRIVLADALHHATTFDPDAIIDLATLTGAIVVSLGHEAAGLFCPDDELAGRLLAASARTGERLWRMPTYEEYGELIKSKWADVKNSAGRWGGACTAARFLFAFNGGRKHAHLDIAGTAWDGRARDYHVDGASGYGVRLLYDALSHWDGSANGSPTTQRRAPVAPSVPRRRRSMA